MMRNKTFGIWRKDQKEIDLLRVRSVTSGQQLSFPLMGIFFSFESCRGMSLLPVFSTEYIICYRDYIYTMLSRKLVNAAVEVKRKNTRKGKRRYSEHDFIPNEGYSMALWNVLVPLLKCLALRQSKKYRKVTSTIGKSYDYMESILTVPDIIIYSIWHKRSWVKKETKK